MRARVVLAHGYHLDAHDWHEVVWGSPEEGRLGRVARAVLAALESECSLLYLGTGASGRDGLVESQVIHHHASKHQNQLVAPAQELLGLSAEEARAGINRVLEELSWCDTTTTNTRQEVRGALEAARALGAGGLVLVSSPTHILRSHREALSLVASEPGLWPLRHGVSAMASDTCAGDTRAADVVVLEPPHRAENGSPSFPRIAAEALPLLSSPELAEGYAQEWAELTQRWRARLDAAGAVAK